MRSRLVRAGLAIVIAAEVAFAAVVVFDRPSGPAASGTTARIARTSLLPPKPTEPCKPTATTWVVGSECLARVVRASAYADLCWLATRHRDEDPVRDYYTLELRGTFGGSSVRWIVVEVRLIDGTPYPGTDGRPTGAGSGCVTVPAGVLAMPGTAPDKLCGRIEGGPGANEGGWRMAWACDPCVFLDDADRAIGMRTDVTVAEDELPNWDLYAALGR